MSARCFIDLIRPITLTGRHLKLKALIIRCTGITIEHCKCKFDSFLLVDFNNSKVKFDKKALLEKTLKEFAYYRKR